MGVFFGTDGIRGKFNDDLNLSVAYNCGNALGREKQSARVIVGSDTRASGKILSLAFACGVMDAGGSVVDVGVCTTAGVAFLTKSNEFDFGVVVSASHNPAEFNGIKIFSSQGRKIGDNLEIKLEKNFFKKTFSRFDSVGSYFFKPSLVSKYYKFLKSCFLIDLTGKKVVLDCANGASFHIAPKLFKSFGAEVIECGTHPNGTNINKNCGAVFADNLAKKVKQKGADFGFAYDGDADRLIAVDEHGNILNGDVLIYLFSKFYQSSGWLKNSQVVGTMHTNLGVERALERIGIKLIRTEIGDKYVSGVMFEQNLQIGGEQSGHIILKDFLPTGDGILSSLLVAHICAVSGKKLSELADIKLFPQENVNIEVEDKVQIISSEKISRFIKRIEEELAGHGRIMIRMSGTEPVIRVMVETDSKSLSQSVSKQITEKIIEVGKELRLCVE